MRIGRTRRGCGGGFDGARWLFDANEPVPFENLKIFERMGMTHFGSKMGAELWGAPTPPLSGPVYGGDEPVHGELLNWGKNHGFFRV